MTRCEAASGYSGTAFIPTAWRTSRSVTCATDLRLLCAGGQRLFHDARVPLQQLPTLAGRCEIVLDLRQSALLRRAVAEAAGTVLRRELFLFTR